MAASSRDDIKAQLAALLGHTVKRIRITDDVPPRISVIDAAIALTGKSHHDVAQYFRHISEQYPEVGTTCSQFRFKGRGQRPQLGPEVRCHSAWITTSRSSSTNLMIHHHRHQNHHQMIHGLANLEPAMFSLGSIGTPKAFRCAPKARWRAEGALSFRD